MPGTLLIHAPVPLFQGPAGPWLERQAINGLRLWAENFDRVLVMLPMGAGAPPDGWEPLGLPDRVELHPLPMAYRPDRFARAYRGTRAQIRALIARADYLSFAIGGLFGDWGAVACLQAHAMRRRYAVWTDRVESQVTRQGAGAGPWRHRLRARLTWRPMAALERHVIRRAALGLFHGRETFDAYAPFCARPELVHNIHLARSDHIAPERLAAKADGAGSGPLRLVYAGRAEGMKGPDDWLRVMAALDARGMSFRAVWHGEGSARPRMQARIAALGLDGRVSAPGFASEPGAVLEALRTAHLFVFCHKTPESPRVLIEALASGCPIAGYDSAFARDLIAGHGGGALVPLGDAQGLADAIARLDADRAALARLIRSAAQDGAPFDDVSVFWHRSDLIKAYLGR